MRRIVSGLFITLDGLVEAPGSADITLPEKAEWNNSTLLRDVGEISKLKQQPGRDINITGSPTLVRSLLEHGLPGGSGLWAQASVSFLMKGSIRRSLSL